MGKRPDYGYIDQAEPDLADPQKSRLDISLDARSHSINDYASGSNTSSIHANQPSDFENSAIGMNMIDIEEKSNNGTSSSSEELYDKGDWDIDDEDWELADGNFTKQYNRARQQKAATCGAGPLPASNQLSKSSSQTLSAHGGVTTNPKASSEKKDRDKSDRATQEQVLDARTRLILTGLVNRGEISKTERCISTGKEANVYFSAPNRAVKIYRTSILVFRSRQNYILGEQRFRGEYISSRNPRKMIRVWAEKELRNLKRLRQGGVRAPTVYECKENVLVMEFLGNDGVASPRLKDAEIESERLPDLYVELMITTRRMFQICHLVHADLSEYNILLHNEHLYIIDVSQSVEHDHPQAFDFLRSDLSNIEEFFGRRGIRTLGLRRSWEFVVSEVIGCGPNENLGNEGEIKLRDIVSEWIKTPSDESDDAVFMNSYIPRTLADVYDPERDVDVLKNGKGDDLIYAGITGLKLASPCLSSTAVDEDEDGLFQNDIVAIQPKADEITMTKVVDIGYEGQKSRGFRHEDRDLKKERKKAVKEGNREKRKHKMPKAEKQRLVKKSSARN
ncbi:uncharacterized protein L203_105099 [Cryptococcus depauperatus CBS 7841]|uniref:Serine/threonine-protein kinase RIO1 n=1 Tax=Cryptococcus depauperatus CBS 7841 TaxID=1295531 RepID=A0A1E3HWQ7_9TREE|nr:Atypical/RIO/RIO1 protein kinase [Cryptococcus depauperatus CBS 7841]